MIPLPEALTLLDGVARPLGIQQVPLTQALGRFLAEPVSTPFDIPPFSKSAMDGFAVRRADLADDSDATLTVAGVIAAGDVPAGPVRPGTAIRIMTGAPVPEGADQVIRVEYAAPSGAEVRFLERERSSNIIERGENAREGDLLLSPRRLNVHDIGVAASVGLPELPVMVQPRLAVVSTGDELVEPGQEAGSGRIYNSNGYQLYAHALRAGFAPSYHGIAADTAEALEAVLREALDGPDVLDEPGASDGPDVLVLSGGVSKGDFDYVPGVLASLGVQEVFHRVAMKPGRPLYLGVRDRESGGRQYVFGLPGNPVSVFVTFELFAVRLLYRMAGLEPPEPSVSATLGEAIAKGDPERTEFIPVTIQDGVARRVRYGGSSHLNALSQADALLEVPVGTTELPKGSVVHARPL